MIPARRARKLSSRRSRAVSRPAPRRPQPATGRRQVWRETIRQLYDGASRRAVRFRYGLLAFDLITIMFVTASSFFLGNPVVEALDIVFGLLILADFAARLFISRSVFAELVHPLGIADVIVILSFLVPTPGENFGFLRVVRALRLFRS
jgi:voltage-gated potassium channel